MLYLHLVINQSFQKEKEDQKRFGALFEAITCDFFDGVLDETT